MIEGHPFLFQPRNGIVYHVTEHGVKMVSSWSSNEGIVAFVNGDKMNFEPDEIIRHPSVKLIIASSPKGTVSNWAKQLGPGAHVTEIAIQLWSPKELFLTG